MKRALIAANGELPTRAAIEALRAQLDLFVCADGAANILRAMELTPDVIIGDLDSITSDTRLHFQSRVELIEERDQESTDLEKALRLCRNRKIERVTVIGVGGKRLDHTISNLSILEQFSRELPLEIREPRGRGIFLHATNTPQSLTVATQPGDTISLLAFRRVEGITTVGLQYPLTDEPLEWATRIGQSNCAIHTQAKITIRSGSLLIFHDSQEACGT